MNKKSVILSLVGFLITVILLLLPHLNTIKLQGENNLDIIYTPSHVNGNTTRFDDQVKLLPAVQLARNGQITGKLGNIEHSNELYPNVLQEIIVAFIYAPVIAVTGEVDSPYYVLPVLVGFIYLMSFNLIRLFGADLICALVLPLIMIFGYFYISFGNYFILPNGISHPEDMLNTISKIENWSSARQYELNSFYRIHTLGGSYFFFLGFVYFFYKCLKDSFSAKKYMLPMAVFLALQFYCYVFYSIAAGMSFLGAALWLFIYSLCTSDDLDLKSQVRYLFYSGVIAFVLALPSIVETLNLVMSKDNADWLSRISGGKGEPKVFWGNNYMYGLLVLSTLLGNNKQIRIVSISLLLSVLLVENSGILFGIEIQPGHIYMRAVIPLAILFAGSILYSNVLKLKKIKLGSLNLSFPLYAYRLLLISLASYSVVSAYNYSYTYAQHTYTYQGISPSQDALHQWLEDKPNALVATLSPEIAVPLMFQSPSYLYITFSGHLHQTVSNSHIDNRLVNLLWLFNADHSQLTQYFDQQQGQEFEKRYHYYYWQRRFGFPRADQRLTEHVQTLSHMLDNYDLGGSEALCQHPFDFLVVDNGNARQAIFEPPKAQYLTEQVRFEQIVVYKLNVDKLDCTKG